MKHLSLYAVILAVTVASLPAACADKRFPGKLIEAPPRCIEIATPASLRDSFASYLDPSMPMTFHCYESQESFELIASSINTQVRKLGYHYEPTEVLRFEDRGRSIKDYMGCYIKAGSRYKIALANLNGLRERGEKIEGTGDYLLVVGAPSLVEKTTTKKGATPENSPDSSDYSPE